MIKYIALLRGINVTGRHILPMKELVGLLEEMGCKEVKTYIQSGNVVFRTEERDAPRLAQRISSRIMKEKGFEPRVWLLDEDEWQKALQNNPFTTEVGKLLHFFFLDSVPDHPDLSGLAALKAEREAFELTGKVFYLYAPDGIGRSKLVEKMGHYIEVPMTARNWNTVRRLTEMLEG